MSSRTLNKIMHHWGVDLPHEGGFADLPFNIESYCREADEEYQALKALARELRDALYVHHQMPQYSEVLLRADQLLKGDAE